MPELIWDGKYDASGRRVPPMRVSLPFQTVETVNESSQERQRTLDLFASGRDTDWRNRLVWGDRKYVLPALLSEFVGAVDLVYIDPPFATGANFSFQVQVDGSDFTKEPTLIEQKAYRDTWGRGLDGYLAWLSESLSYLYQLLAPNGSLYLHLDWRVVHYAKAILDEIFGTQGFRNEIIWKRTTAHSDAHTAGAIHDTLLFLFQVRQVDVERTVYSIRTIVSGSVLPLQGTKRPPLHVRRSQRSGAVRGQKRLHLERCPPTLAHSRGNDAST